MRRSDVKSSVTIFCFGLFVVLYSFYFDIGGLRKPGPGLMPFLAGVAICAFSTITFLTAFFHESDDAKKIWDKVNFKSIIVALVALIAYPLLLNPLGFTICTFFLTLILMRYAGFQTWKISVLGATLSSIIIYVLFEWLLNANLPKGILNF